ncbi:Hypp2252 [Branchiostoma lanceolatum]|uniref:Hypp2252 protein n=1 Tax=Branchiostoma lanceolatum TaxID=7740 RepID=A0A8J9ZSJ1_BRALA|nr:Hypp2252 [Branchiostoma lanceolatum]
MEAINATAATLAPDPPYGVAVVSVGCLLLIVAILITIFCLVETTDDKDDKLLADLEAMDPKGKDPEVQMLRLEYKLKAVGL